MHWDAIVVSVRDEKIAAEVKREFSLLLSLSVLSSPLLSIVEDACEGAGSAGSALNALLVVVRTERFCSLRGYSVLNESVLQDSAILIVLLGETGECRKLSSAFLSISPVSSWKERPETVLTRNIQSINRLAERGGKGVWIAGSDCIYSLMSLPVCTLLSQNTLSLFAFRGDTRLQSTHGQYHVDEEGNLSSLSFETCVSDPSASLILSLLYLPPPIAILFLSLHSLHPISACTYYGTDTGTIPLKLSLFFDLVQSTCMDEESFLRDRKGQTRIDSDEKMRTKARQQLHRRMKNVKTSLVMLELDSYQYLANEHDALQLNPEKKGIEEIRCDWIQALLGRIRSAIINHPEPISQFVKPILEIDRIFNRNNEGAIRLLETLENVCVSSSALISARCLSLTSDLLSEMASSKGGLRSGPAANPVFLEIFQNIKQCPHKGLAQLFSEIRLNWLRSPSRLIRAARHLDAAAHIVGGKVVEQMCRPFLPTLKVVQNKAPPSFKKVIVKAAARVDIFGGWLDTPPITLAAQPSAVINMAVLIDSKYPLSCSITISEEKGLTIRGDEGVTVTMTSSKEIWDNHSQPSHFGSLICACLVALGLIQSPNDDLFEVLMKHFGSVGVQVECTSDLPHGSGLGTSSILSACVIIAILRTIGVQERYIDRESIIHTVLYVEQLLTTGGGWQDQVGGVYGGIKTGFIRRENDVLSVGVRNIPTSKNFETEINSRLLLIYTGKTRLAKNLLQEVVRSWYGGGEVVDCVREMQDSVELCENCLKQGLFPLKFVEMYYKAKKRLASGCEPKAVETLIRRLKEANQIEGAWLAGAGGGGFLYVWLSTNGSREGVEPLLEQGMSCHSANITNDPVIIETFQ